ncbi:MULTISPECIES: hypothetical protein [Rhodococcus]|uniref:hypothetical protein n=1 Tax=Rhodococcus TaxID=1827 RepID=UPI001E29EBD9|nr:hypothetical protein [Rhodococcus pyridinivorans]MCD2119111.1 hypothetical protein [Rhodococcus pyridinivorans]MCZ4627996.1 hypothetical protein [Rhodococcus pyridinivorans]MCZ4649252.1 hypothetical protein [Rhodococcus pyridinivorans]MDJ0483440.1 hypothetical protein [Rhodococcus pyridinivorans]MDV7255311.1 hypothetical protein [Rhodococcus pyridinivorans]
MNDYYPLGQARKDFPALHALYNDDHAALNAAHPLVDQAKAGNRPVIRSLEEGGILSVREHNLSPAARLHPVLSEGIDRARKIPPRFDLVGLAGVDRVYGNTGRGLLPYSAYPHTVVDLREEERDRLGITHGEQAMLDVEYVHALELADYGGSLSSSVVFHLAEWTEDDGALACPVVAGWSAWRIVNMVVVSSCVCYWCNDKSSKPLRDYLLVSCGGTLRVFSTCSPCREGFDRDTEPGGLHWRMNDDWFHATGCPSDEWI